MRSSFVLSVFSVVLVGSTLFGQDSQTIKLDHKLQIPGATLKPGEYTFSLEDRLQDRAIIRITSARANSHELVLAVPSDKLNQAEHGNLIFFPGTDSDKRILQGWICPGCQSALEVVYPKDEAVKITSESAKPVMAVDPSYDKLPKNLSPDDMKVVTLWLLSPKEITPAQKGKGVEAAKYADLRNNGQHTQIAGMPSHTETKAAPADTDVPTANIKPLTTSNLNDAPTTVARARRMPHTASNVYTFGLIGCSLLLAGITSYIQRRFAPRFVKTRR